jgi:hypothetical protein
MAGIVRGKIQEISSVDLSKTASVENMYTEVLLDIEEVTPLERKKVVTRDIVFFRQGKVPLQMGDRVKLSKVLEQLDEVMRGNGCQLEVADSSDYVT